MSRPTNIFELLEDENDTEVKKVQQTQKKTSAPAPQPQKKTEQKTDRAVAEGKGRENRPPRQQNDRPVQRQAQKGADSGAPSDFQGGERRNRPPRAPRTGGEGRERREKQAEREERPGQRAFDRRSGTGRGKEGKRGGGGRGNWGTVEDDKKAQLAVEEPTEKPKEESTEQASAAPTEAKTETTPETVQQPEQKPEDEEDAKLKTLEDYLKEKKAPAVALPPPRVVEDKGEWSKFTPLKRDEDSKPQKKEKKADSKEEGPKKVIPADQVLKFTETSPNASFRGGRGRGKRGGSKVPAPNFKDKEAFPSLSTATKA